MAERYTGRKFIDQELTGYTDLHRSAGKEFWSGWRIGAKNEINGDGASIVFDWSPAISITAVTTVDSSNTESAYSSDNYYLDNYDDDKAPELQFNDSASIPGDLRVQDSWKVVWRAGYGTASTDVPASIRRAIMMLAGHLYENRGDCEGELCGVSGAYSMLSPFKVLRG